MKLLEALRNKFVVGPLVIGLGGTLTWCLGSKPEVDVDVNVAVEEAEGSGTLVETGFEVSLPREDSDATTLEVVEEGSGE